MNIFDAFIQDTPFSNSVDVTHYKVTEIIYDERNEPIWEKSTKIANSFKALDSEEPDEKYEFRKKDYGRVEQDDRHIFFPSWLKETADQFKGEGLQDRFEIDGKLYIIQNWDEDSFFDHTYFRCYLRHIVGETVS